MSLFAGWKVKNIHIIVYHWGFGMKGQRVKSHRLNAVTLIEGICSVHPL